VTRHGPAVILLGGLLLMIPPVDHGYPENFHDAAQLQFDYKVRPGVPVADWHQEAAFDTAERCERARGVVLKERLEGVEKRRVAAAKSASGAADDLCPGQFHQFSDPQLVNQGEQVNVVGPIAARGSTARWEIDLTCSGERRTPR
jgi:hypothetical protein